jgi:hypothetical protein
MCSVNLNHLDRGEKEMKSFSLPYLENKKEKLVSILMFSDYQESDLNQSEVTPTILAVFIDNDSYDYTIQFVSLKNP